jgi:hypothetical protein
MTTAGHFPPLAGHFHENLHKAREMAHEQMFERKEPSIVVNLSERKKTI